MKNKYENHVLLLSDVLQSFSKLIIFIKANKSQKINLKCTPCQGHKKKTYNFSIEDDRL